MVEETVPHVKRQDLAKIALTCLRTARMVMESGANARTIAQSAESIAGGLGAPFQGLRIGYASLAITLGDDCNMLTRMISVGRHGVNYRMDCAVRKLVRRVIAGGMSSADVDAELDLIAAHTPKHSPAFIALAVGIACAAFGRLLGVDWQAFGPLLLAGCLGQLLRYYLLHYQHKNPCVVAAAVAFFNALITGYGARLAGSDTVNLAMVASILLLVPGVPATNAQTDIMDGHPTTGSARAVSVAMIMIFATTGVWLAGTVLGVQP